MNVVSFALHDESEDEAVDENLMDRTFRWYSGWSTRRYVLEDPDEPEPMLSSAAWTSNFNIFLCTRGTLPQFAAHFDCDNKHAKLCLSTLKFVLVLFHRPNMQRGLKKTGKLLFLQPPMERIGLLLWTSLVPGKQVVMES